MQVTDLKAILDYEHNEQWLAALNCYKGIWDHNPTDDVAIRYCFFCWYLIWQWEQIDFPGEDISFEAKITVDNRMGISKAELEHTLSSIACGYYNNFQIEYCRVSVSADRSTDQISAVIQLWNGSTRIARWTDSGTGYLLFSNSATVSKGKTYELTVDVKINGVSKPQVSIEGTCK